MTRRLRIAVIGHIRNPVGRPFRGGMEAHCYHLVHGLQARGHDVTLFAPGDSAVDVPLVPLVARHADAVWPWHEWRGSTEYVAFQDATFAAALPRLAAGGFDVIHNNSLHRYPARLARRDRLPMLTSLHVPPFDPLHRAVRDGAAPWSRFTICSQRQRDVWWPEGAPEEAHVVPNGIDLAQWPFRAEGDGTLVWAGRITATKAPHLAAEAARRAGLPLTLYGVIEDDAYFRAEVAPRLGGAVRYGGHLSGADLARALGRASALLFTPHWDEPFGLAAVEAMACGLPVAATDMGAVREVLGEAGRLAPAEDARALAAAARAAMAIPRHVPRRRAERLFSLDRMIDDYEALYRRAIAGRAAALRDPGFRAHELPPVLAAE
ncbi:glycosyltransferase [Roseivivax sp. CAU 1761]